MTRNFFGIPSMGMSVFFFLNLGELVIAYITHGIVLVFHLLQTRGAWGESLKEGPSRSICPVGFSVGELYRFWVHWGGEDLPTVGST